MRDGFACLLGVVHQLGYVSVATAALDRSTVADILTTARTRNADVTGVLLYRDGRFLQLLEGSVPSMLWGLWSLLEPGPARDATPTRSSLGALFARLRAARTGELAEGPAPRSDPGVLADLGPVVIATPP